MGEWTVIPSLKADGHAILVHKRLPVASFGPTPHEVACANFAQNKRAESVAATMNAMQGIPDPAAFVAAAKALREEIRCLESAEFYPHCDGPTATKSVYGRCESCYAMAKFDQALAAKDQA